MLLVLITHDEFTFNANGGKRRVWMTKDQPPLRQKIREKGVMASGFLHLVGGYKFWGILQMICYVVLRSWPRTEDGQPQRDAMVYPEYGRVALPTFCIAFPGLLLFLVDYNS